jgi:hypothetical protein
MIVEPINKDSTKLPVEAIVKGENSATPSLMDKEDTELLNSILAKWDKADKWFESNLRKDFEYCRDASVSFLRDKNNWTVKYPIFDPTSEKVADGLIAKYLIGLFANGGVIEFDIDWDGAGNVKTAKALKKLMQTAIRKMPGFASTMITFIRQIVIYGTGIVKVVWDTDIRKVKLVKRDEDGNPVIVKNKVQFDLKEATYYEGAKIVPIDVVNEFRVDPDAIDFYKADKFHRTWVQKELLLEGQAKGLYVNVDKISTGTNQKDSLPRSYDNLNPKPSSTEQDSGKVEVIEAWLNNDSKKICIANRTVIITPKDDRDNPYLYGKSPFAYAVFCPVDFQIYGRGAMLKAKPQQTAINVLSNLELEQAFKHICAMWGYIEGECPPGETLVFKPDGKVPLVSKDSLFRLEQGSFDLQSINRRRELQLDIEEITGATKVSAMASGSSSNGTATGDVIRQRVGNELHAAHMWVIDQLGIINIVDMIYRLYLQCGNKELFAKFNEDEILVVDPRELPYEASFIPKVGADVMDKDTKIRDFNIFLQSVLPILMQAGIKMSYGDLVKMGLEMIGIHSEELGIDTKAVSPNQEQNQGGSQPGNAPTSTVPTPQLAGGMQSPPMPPVNGGMMGGQNG